MVPRLVPEISSLDAFCDTGAAVVVVGIGDFRSWMWEIFFLVFKTSGKEMGLGNDRKKAFRIGRGVS